MLEGWARPVFKNSAGTGSVERVTGWPRVEDVNAEPAIRSPLNRLLEDAPYPRGGYQRFATRRDLAA